MQVFIASLLVCLTWLVVVSNCYFGQWNEADHSQLGIETYDVIIVGAGMSGISAGRTLAASNITNFKIIEADDYIGGRTKVGALGDISVNIGASWIQHIANESMFDNPSFVVAHDMSLTGHFHEWSSDVSFSPLQSYLNGIDENVNYTSSDFRASDYFTPLDTDALWADWDNITYCMSAMVNYTDAAGFDLSFRAILSLCGWNHVIAQKYDRTMINDSLNFVINDEDINETLQGIIANMIEWYELDFEWATSPDLTSVDEYAGEYLYYYGTTQDEYTWLDYFITDCRGYQGVTLSVAAEYLSSSTYLDETTNCLRTRITDERVVLNSIVSEIEYYSNGAYVYTQSAQNESNLTIYAARYVILTPSVGVLQSDLITFEPQLPFWKQVSIAEYSMVRYGAMYVQFPYAFWGDSAKDLNDTYNLVFPDYDRGHLIWALNINDPSLWDGSNTLRFDMTECLVERLSYMSKQEIKDMIQNKLQQYFSFQVPQPSDVLYMDWYTHPYTRGSWVSYDIHLERKHFLWLKAPVKRVFFSGEHTAGNISGFVHGAYAAGAKTAGDVIDCIHFGDTSDECVMYQFAWNYTSETTDESSYQSTTTQPQDTAVTDDVDDAVDTVDTETSGKDESSSCVSDGALVAIIVCVTLVVIAIIVVVGLVYLRKSNTQQAADSNKLNVGVGHVQSNVQVSAGAED